MTWDPPMNAAMIQRLILQRPPFLYVDRIVEIDDRRIVAVHRPDAGADYFRGHFPGNPVMPGVLLCECCFQAGAALLMRCLEGEPDRAPDPATDRAAGGAGQPAGGATPVVTRIGEAKFKRIVRPGDDLNIEVTLDEELGGAYFMTGRVTVDGRAVLRVTFGVTLMDATDGAAGR